MSLFLDNVLLFVQALRQAGLRVSLDQSISFVRALDLLDIGQRHEIYHAGRSLLVSRREDQAVYDVLFHRFFRFPLEPPRPKRRRQQSFSKGEVPFTVATYLTARARAADQEVEIVDRSETFSDQESLQSKEFSEMTAEELANVRRLMAEMRFAACERKTRRMTPARSGHNIDFARTLREAARYGAVPLDLPRCREKIKQRPVVLLADISGSMEKYSRLVLHFFYSVAHSMRDVESFVFGTRLSRLTPQLKLRNVDRAVEMAARQALDWGGGTRIGACLHDFNRRWSRRLLRRGAIVLITSDGWERSDSALLGREMRYLQHRCHRLIWLNPLAGKATYQPRVGGMAAALPFVDDFLPIHNLQSLGQLAEHLRALPSRRGQVAGLMNVPSEGISL